jgi:TonB family protein
MPAARVRTAPRGRDQPAAFGRYLVKELVGEGSMGRVYRGFDPLAHRPVAIKTVRPEYRSGPEAEEYLARFRREAQAAAGLSHPNIVTVFDVGEDYFVMELLEGTTLEAVLKGHARLSPSAVLDILGPIAEAMDLAHRKGIIHRDIKPANIFLLRDGRPKIMDFGVAHLRAAAMTAAGTLWGSPSYMAPEQVTNSRASASTDVFSLGIVAYQMLTGRKPFEGENISAVLYRVVHTEAAAVSAQAPDLPARYDEVFRRALAKDPAGRFPTATALVTAVGGGDLDAPDLTPSAAPSAAGPPGATPSMEDVETHELKRALQRVGDRPARTLASWVRRLRSRRELVAIGLVALAGLILAVISGGRLPWATGGSVEITTEPPHATVRIDGVVAGTTPVTRRGLGAGAHTLQLTLAGYAPTEMTLQLDDDPVPTPLRFALQPTAASLHVGSQPPGATVRVDGASVGVTPLSGFPASPGAHDVAVEARGYRPWRQKVHLGAGTEVSLSPKLTPIAGASSTRLEALGWVRPGDLVELGPGVTPPRRISGQPAPYPAAARRQKVGGTVVVELTVTERGEPDNVRVVRSGGAILDAGMTAAVRTWRYAPAERNGVKVRVRIRTEQQFRYRK